MHVSKSRTREDGSAAWLRVSRRGLIIPLLTSSLACLAQVSVTTQHNDIGRTGQNVNETILTPANVNSASFGKLFSQLVDEVVFAQPLYLPNQAIPGAGTHNVVFVATENDSVYAFDADNNGGGNGAPLWTASLTSTTHGAAAGATSVSSLELGENTTDLADITGTPVIDPVNGTLYVVSFTQEGSSFVLRLHALQVTTGHEQTGSPVTIQASVAGTGAGSSGGVLTFDPAYEQQRPGLLLLDGVVYIGFGSFGDQGPWHGWILAYDETSLSQLGAYCASPNGGASAFWMSGAGLAADTDNASADPKGRIFAATGNGDFDATSATEPGADFGDSILNLSLLNGALAPIDFFTPAEQAFLNASDGDLGSGGVLVIPDADVTTGAVAHLLVQAGKEGKIYLLNRDKLGSYNPAGDQVVQELANGTTSSSWINGLWGLPAYWNQTLYFPGRGAPLQAFAFNNGLLTTSPVDETTEILSYPGPSPSISANGTTDGIVWLLESKNPSAPGAVLEAYDALNLQNLLYSSQTNASRDGMSTGIKFTVPTVADGKVFAASRVTDPLTGVAQGELNVFGLLASVSTAAAPVFTPAGKTFTPPLTVTITDSTPNAQIYYTTDGSIPSALSTRYTAPIVLSTIGETITAIASAPNYLQSPPVSQKYTSTTQTPDPAVTASGIYPGGVTVTITDSLTTASFYYTTDGTTPTNTSTKYGGPISLSVAGLTALKVIAQASGLSPSNVITRQYEITVGRGLAINCGNGFSTCALLSSGGAAAVGTVLQLTNGGFNQASSAFWNEEVSISSFTTDFSFQLSPVAGTPFADGFTFTLLNGNPVAEGSGGAGLGYAGFPNSFALKFDFFNDAGEGNNSTGVYVDGANPTVPAVNLNGTGINLSSNDQFDAHLVYNASTTTLDLTITDLTLGNVSWSTAFNVDIQTAVGGTSAFAGFTGSTSSTGTSNQKILGWTYQSGVSPVTPTAPPVFSVGSGAYTGPQTVTLTDTTPGAVIYYTTGGSQPSTSSAVYSTPISAANETITTIAVAPGDLMSGPVSNTYTHGDSFAFIFSATSPLTLNGSAAISGNTLELTNGGSNEAASAFFSTPINVQSFNTGFTFQLTNPSADGFTFTIQNAGPTALGADGGSLGYAGIGHSVALKFDLYQNSGEPSNSSTGIFVDGAQPIGAGSIDLTASGINLHSGDAIQAVIKYDGVTLTLQLMDMKTGASFSHAFAVNIPAIVGGDIAYVGFTAGTGGLSSVQRILSWNYDAAPPIDYPAGFSGTGNVIVNGSAQISGGSIKLTDGGSNEAASAFFVTPVNIDAFTTDFDFQLTNAAADGFAFVIQNAGVHALGPDGGSLGYAGIGKSVALKFDLFQNTGDVSNDSTGIFVDGATPIGPTSIDLTGGGINLHSGDTMDASLTYNGTTLTLTITDLATAATWSHPFAINIPATVGANTAYVGFTAGDGGLTSTQQILSWTFE